MTDTNNSDNTTKTLEVIQPVQTGPVIIKDPQGVAVKPSASSSSDDIMIAGVLLPIVLLGIVGGGFGISHHIGSERKEEALNTAATEIGQAFGEWSTENAESAASMNNKELSYDQFTQKMSANTERDDVVERSNFMYSAGESGNYEICVITSNAGDRPDNIHIYSSETNMVAKANKCN